MSKSRKPRSRKSKSGGAKAAAAPETGRRDVLKLVRNGAIAAVAVGGGSYFAFGSFRAYAAEHDLKRLGQGKPVIVQIHDPQCPICTSLQKQTRKALKEFDEGDLIFLVADVKTEEGQAFAVRHGVGNVTLLLFDGQGTLMQTLHGMKSSEELGEIFRTYHSDTARS